jgi:hypothetical protein
VRNPFVKQHFPLLDDSNHNVTSPRSVDYNCIAWAAGDPSRFWWPGEAYWPPGVPTALRLQSFIEAFRSLNYEVCDDAKFEDGFEKIAIYTKATGEPTHAARQISDDFWTSKLGKNVDIEHTIDALDGPAYGKIAVIMKRSHQ